MICKRLLSFRCRSRRWLLSIPWRPWSLPLRAGWPWRSRSLLSLRSWFPWLSVRAWLTRLARWPWPLLLIRVRLPWLSRLLRALQALRFITLWSVRSLPVSLPLRSVALWPVRPWALLVRAFILLWFVLLCWCCNFCALLRRITCRLLRAVALRFASTLSLRAIALTLSNTFSLLLSLPPIRGRLRMC